jgi:hypothetical protein
MAVFERELKERMAAVQVQFGAEVRAVRIHRARADPEFRGNLPAGLVLGDQP